jgi:hypothetical protein
MNNKLFFSVIIVIVLVLGVLLAIQNHRLRNDLEWCNKLNQLHSTPQLDGTRVKKLLDTYLKTELGQSDANWKIVLFFAPEDCPECINEITYINKLVESHKDLTCIGLVNHPHSELVRGFIKSMKWSFNVKIIKENLFGENFGFFKTPIKVLLNSRNHMYYIEGPLPNWVEDGKFRFILEDLFKK